MRDFSSFLQAHGFGNAVQQPLPGDASFRRYVRLVHGPRPALLMDAPPPEDVRPFLRIARHLHAAGLSAPEIIAADEANGYLLLEDFGQDTHATLLDAGADPLPLYIEAAATLGALHAAPPPEGLHGWEGATMARATAATFLDWWWPATFGAPASDAVRVELDDALRAMLAPFEGSGCFVHRDYFPANLMRLDREGPQRTGLLDFQDAALGHPAYDLVSLVEDARRDVREDARDAAIAAYLSARPDLDRSDFAAAMAACAAQRHLRVAALWTRLANRDGKRGYLIHGPRCWRLLDRALVHPSTAALREFLDRHVPPGLRRNPASVTESA